MDLVSKPKITFTHSDESRLDEIKVLWEHLNQCMNERSTHFKQHFTAMAFAKRKMELSKKASCGVMRVDLAVEESCGEIVGYLVSSVNSEKVGCVESIFVSELFRGIGVGDKLMSNALAWMEEKGAVEKVLEVTVGNEQVHGFYERFGFLHRQTLFKQVNKNNQGKS